MILEVNMNNPGTVMSKILLGRIILYGWVFSWLFLFAGLGTMEWAMETGEPVFLKGLLMFWSLFFSPCSLSIFSRKRIKPLKSSSNGLIEPSGKND